MRKHLAVFTAGTLLLVIPAVACDWMAQSKIQQRVRVAVEDIGGCVLYDHEYDFPDKGGPVPYSQHAEFLAYLLGRDCIYSVVYVQVPCSSSIGSSILVDLKELRGLQHIVLFSETHPGDVERLSKLLPCVTIEVR